MHDSVICNIYVLHMYTVILTKIGDTKDEMEYVIFL